MSAVNVAHSINTFAIGLPLDFSPWTFFSLLWPIVLSANPGVKWMDCSLDLPLDPNYHLDYTPRRTMIVYLWTRDSMVS